MRRVLSEQRWPRDDQGIFDRTHLRWFSWRDADQLVAEAGFRVKYIDPQYWERGRGRAECYVSRVRRSRHSYQPSSSSSAKRNSEVGSRPRTSYGAGRVEEYRAMKPWTSSLFKNGTAFSISSSDQSHHAILQQRLYLVLFETLDSSLAGLPTTMAYGGMFEATTA